MLDMSVGRLSVPPEYFISLSARGVASGHRYECKLTLGVTAKDRLPLYRTAQA